LFFTNCRFALSQGGREDPLNLIAMYYPSANIFSFWSTYAKSHAPIKSCHLTRAWINLSLQQRRLRFL